MSIDFYFDYKIETLLKKFIENVDNENLNDPFYSPLIIVPNINVLKWIQMTFASEKSICFNIDFQFLENGIEKTLSRLAGINIDDFIFLSHKENHVEFQLMILSVLYENKNIELFNEYLGDKNNPDYASRIWQVSDRLTKYFREYEYQRNEIISKWKDNKIYYTDFLMEKNQYEIYKKIFFNDGILDKLNKSDKKILTLPQFTDLIFRKLKKENKKKTSDCISIFGFSQISKFHYDLLIKLSEYIDISIYQLSFLHELSPKKTVENENELLHLWGRPSIENSWILNDLINEHKTDYAIGYNRLDLDNEKTTTSNLLKILQNRIANGKLYNEDIIQNKKDNSLRIYGCTDIYREAETVYNSIIYNMKNDNKLKLTDIAIFVTDMQKYKNVIKSVFLNGSIDKPEIDINSKPAIPFNLTDSTANEDSAFGKALLKILNLPANNFSRKYVFDLILNPIFLSSNNISRKEAVLWLNWINDLNIIHGYDDCKYDFYSWQQGFKRLRYGRIMDPGEGNSFRNFNGIIPYSNTDGENMIKLNKFNETIESLLYRLNKLENITLSGTEWADEILSLINDYLKLPDNEEQEIFVINKLIDSFGKLKTFDLINENKKILSLPYIIEFIKSNLTEISSSIGHYLTDGVTISSLLPLRPIPFKIIYILGMDESRFPGSADNSTLDLRNYEKKIGDISVPDANKYLFLETVMSAKEKLYISYISSNIQKDEDLLPSSIINQLIDYVEKKILNDKFEIVNLPLKGYSKKYFQEKNRAEYPDLFENNSYCYNLLFLKNISNLDIFQKNIINIEFEHAKRKFKIDYAQMADNDITKVSIAELAKFILNPVDALIKRNFKFYDEEDDKSLLENEPFYSEFPTNYNIITNTLKQYITENNHDGDEKIFEFYNNYYNHSLLQSSVPSGDFGNVDKKFLLEMIEERINSKDDGLKNFIYNMKDTEFYIKTEIGNKTGNSTINFPPVKFLINDKKVELSGNLEYLWNSAAHINTLIITNSKYSNRISKFIISPFLFYLLLLCVDSPAVFNVEQSDFIICTSYRIIESKGMLKTFYKVDRNTAYGYLQKLLEDYLTGKEYDMLPFTIVSDLINRFGFDPGKITKQSIEEEIEESENSEFSALKITELIDIINPSVPKDAFKKIKQRYELLYNFVSKE